MTEPEEPQVTEVPEPDQEPHEPIPDEAEADEEADVDTDDALDAEEGEPEAQAPLGVFDDPERRRKVERSFDTYSRMVGTQYEEGATELIRCPLCPDNFPGFVHPNDFGKYPEEVKGVVMQVLGFAREQEYEPDPEARQCPTCKGKGFTKLPTHVPGQEKRTCPGCGGRGYVGLVAQNGRSDRSGEAAALPAIDLSQPLSSGPVDMWGEPEILPNGAPNPNYGKLPDHKVLVQPWGVTAGLTAQDVSA